MGDVLILITHIQQGKTWVGEHQKYSLVEKSFQQMRDSLCEVYVKMFIFFTKSGRVRTQI